MLKKIVSIAMIAIGIVVIVLGVGLMDETAAKNSFSHSTSYHDAEGVTFGGDFYTYIYGASDTIVDELYDINRGISEMVDAQSYQIQKAAETTTAIYKAGGMTIVAIGLAIVASALALGASAFTPAPAPRFPEPTVYEYPVQQ